MNNAKMIRELRESIGMSHFTLFFLEILKYNKRDSC